jgi:hypothetical protein
VVLGQRFKVLILLPVTFVAIVVAMGAGLDHPQLAWSIGQAATLVVISLQFGYLFGIGIHYLTGLLGGGRRRPAPLGGSLPPRHAAR